MDNNEPTMLGIISHLPISEEDKQGLITKFEAEGADAVKPVIQKIIDEAGAMLEYKTQVENIVQEAEQQVAAVEQDAHNQYIQASKDMDSLEMDQAKDIIAGQ